MGVDEPNKSFLMAFIGDKKALVRAKMASIAMWSVACVPAQLKGALCAHRPLRFGR